MCTHSVSSSLRDSTFCMSFLNTSLSSSSLVIFVHVKPVELSLNKNWFEKDLKCLEKVYSSYWDAFLFLGGGLLFLTQSFCVASKCLQMFKWWEKNCSKFVSEWVDEMPEEDGKLLFPLIKEKRKQNKKNALMKTVNAYLIMIHCLFQENLSRKMRERNRWPIFIVVIISVPFLHRSALLLRPPVQYFVNWHCDALVEDLAWVWAGLACTECWESTRHWFVPSPSQSRTDNISCFPQLWQLSAHRHTTALNANVCLVLIKVCLVLLEHLLVSNPPEWLYSLLSFNPLL